MAERLRGVVTGWGSRGDWGWVAAQGRHYFLHASEVDRELAVFAGVVVEFDVAAKPRGLAAVKVRVLDGVPLPAVGPRVAARVVQAVPQRGYAVVVVDGGRRAICMHRDFADDIHGEPLGDGDVLEGELVAEQGHERWRLLNVRVVQYAAGARRG